MTIAGVELQFVWHFHQPYLGLPEQKQHMLPWVRLHAVRAYYDMGCMLMRHPGVCATINFSGCLLRQLREYVDEGKRDVWWDLSARDASSLDTREQLLLLRHFFSVDVNTTIATHARYHELYQKRAHTGEDPTSWSVQELRDLQVWFNLAWCGFSMRRERAIVLALLEKGQGFTEQEKEALLEQHSEVMGLIPGLYQELHKRGQVELCVSPMYHPILPLLVDSDSAARATPNMPRPKRMVAVEDAWIQMQDARQVLRDFIGVELQGMWPAEGAISSEMIALFDEFELLWTASDEEILAHSLPIYNRTQDLYKTWSVATHESVALYFRDRKLSLCVAHDYAHMDEQAAVDEFLAHLEQIKVSWDDKEQVPVVTVILEGAHLWDAYEGDGEAFLSALYERLLSAPW